METDEVDCRWPFPIRRAPRVTHAVDPGNGHVVSALVTPATNMLDTEPHELSALYNRVDPDSVDQLLDSVPRESPTGLRIAVETSWEDASVVATDAGHVAAYPSNRTPNRLNPTAQIHHEWSDDPSLVWSIGRAISTAASDAGTGTDSSAEPSTADIVDSLLEQLDADALERTLHPRLADERTDSRLLLSTNGYEVQIEPDGTIATEPSLTVLKRDGGTVLVVGSVPEDAFDRATATLLGSSDEENTPLFVHHGQNVATARRRLSMAGHPQSTATVLDHRTSAARSTAAAPGGDSPLDHDANNGPTVISHTDSIESLPGAVHNAIVDGELSDCGQLRVGVDSVHSMLESTSLERTQAVIDGIGREVREHRGIGHFHLSAPRDDDAVASLEPLFDAVVELRVGDVDVEQRWRLTETGYETDWFPLT